MRHEDTIVYAKALELMHGKQLALDIVKMSKWGRQNPGVRDSLQAGRGQVCSGQVCGGQVGRAC